MTAEDSLLRKFETRVRQLILAYSALKERNLELKKDLQVKDTEIEKLNARILELESQCKSLKMAKSIGGDTTDVAATKAQLNKMIRDINRCIELLISNR